MALAYDTHSSPAAIGVGDFSWTHTPVGTPRGVILLGIQNANFNNQVNSITYGGNTLTAAPLNHLSHSTGTEDGAIYCFYLSGNIPSGAQTVVVDTVEVSNMMWCCITVTAAVGKTIAVEDTTVLDSGGVANPSVNVTLGAGVEAFIVGALHSGHQAPTSLTVGADYTRMSVSDADFGAQCLDFQRRTSNATGAGDFAVDWTAATEEAGIFAAAFKEVDAPATAANQNQLLMGVG